jgi:surfactin synthase thioesterase subunit
MRKAQVHLICLPFAGGNSYSYLDLAKSTASFVKVLPIELPGRGRRFADPLLTDIRDMAQDALTQTMEIVATKPYALFGHSLGAKLAYVLARRIAHEGLPAPAHLFVSGGAGPSVPPKNLGRHLLPREAFFEMIKELQGTPREVLEEEALMDLFEPMLRADFQANDTYDYRRQGPLTVPVTVMIGTNDRVSYDEALRWEEETTGKTQLHQFSGGHFFIFEHWHAIGQIVSERLQGPRERDPAL